ncbi:MAG: hypothetical protein IT186_03490 [Acidobacteria bacterium]|nr:hypothetical protein [Acidobacteriota bacterium]
MSVLVVLRLGVVSMAMIAGSARSDCDATGGTHLPHSFNIPMGVVSPAGCHAVELNGIYQEDGGSSRGDFGGHASFSFFDWGGVHLRSQGIGTAPTTEVIGMVGLLRDKARRNGLSALVIVGLPTGPSDGHGHDVTGTGGAENPGPQTTFLTGVAWRLTLAEWLLWDANVHYDFTLDHVVPESGLTARVHDRVFTNLEVRATLGDGSEVLGLAGVKYRAGRGLFVGLGYEAALTTSRPYDRRLYFQVEILSH